jgi:hypothetical protein
VTGSTRVAAITVNWNGTERSLRCLESVAGGAPGAMLILVDNGSSDDPSASLRERLPEARLVRLDRNSGYAAGCNAGAQAAMDDGATHLLFLNSDVVIEPNAVDALIAADMTHPGCILGPKIVYEDRPEVIWSAGGYLVRPLMNNHHLGKDEPASAHTTPCRVDWTTGCAFFVSADVYRRVGPLDEKYFLYLEDTDWCLRAAGVGVDTWFVPDSVVRHEVSSTVESLPPWQVRYYAYRNHYRLAFLHGPLGARPLVLADAALTLCKAGARSLVARSYRHDRYYHARTRGVADFVLGRWGAAPE